MTEAKMSLINVEKPEIDLRDAPKETRAIIETLLAYIAPERTRRLRQIAREEALADTEAEVTADLMRASGKVRESQILAEGDRELGRADCGGCGVVLLGGEAGRGGDVFRAASGAVGGTGAGEVD